MKRLDAADQKAVDLILEKSTEGAPYASAADVSPARSSAVGKILSLLQQMPAVEPSPDLVARTLRHVEKSAGLPASGSISPGALPGLGNQPVA